MYKKLLFVLSFFYLSTFAFSQGSVFKYARQIVDTMASESMHGRGYVNDGDKIAANYIKTEFQKIGLKSFQEGYYQKFSFPINTFPSKMYVAIDGKELVPGKDYIVSERSGSGKGEYLLKKYTSNTDGFVDVPKKDKQYAVVVDDSKKEPIRQLSRGPIVYVTNKKY